MPPVEALNEHVELAEPADGTERLVGLHDAESPVEGLTEMESATWPENPPKLEAVIVDEPLEPNWNETLDGFGESAKSATLTVT